MIVCPRIIKKVAWAAFRHIIYLLLENGWYHSRECDHHHSLVCCFCCRAWTTICSRRSFPYVHSGLLFPQDESASKEIYEAVTSTQFRRLSWFLPILVGLISIIVAGIKAQGFELIRDSEGLTWKKLLCAAIQNDPAKIAYHSCCMEAALTRPGCLSICYQACMRRRNSALRGLTEAQETLF